MQKLDELIQAKLQQYKREGAPSLPCDVRPRKSMRLLYRALILMGLVLLSLVVAWACFRTGF